MRARFLTASVAVSAIVLAGCASGPTTEVSVYTAPTEANVAGVRSIAVRPFERDKSEAFSRSLETILANVAVTDKNQERRNIVDIVGIDRTRSITPGQSDPAALGAAAKRLKVDAVLTGEIVETNTSSQPYQSSKSICTHQVTKVDKKGRSYQECGGYRDVSVPCVKNVATVKVNYRLVSATGQVLSRKSAQASLDDHACEGKRVPRPDGTWLERLTGSVTRNELGGPIIPPGELLAAAYNGTAQQIKDALVPQQKTLKVAWLSGTEGLKEPQSKERFEGALKFAGANRADRACETFRELYVREQQSVDLHYNVGLCDEIDGQIDQAQRKYIIADKMLVKPNDTISGALKRTSAQVKAMDVIAEKRPEVLDAPAVARGSGKAKVNPINASASIDTNILETMKKERRVALVIGNSNYRNVAVLRNSRRDATDVEVALKAVGFDVISGYDLDHQATLNLINRFKSNVRKGDVAVVYFAGHGIAVENSNLLLPIDFSSAYAKTPATARSKAIGMEETLAPILKNSGARFSMIVADACREVPQLAAGSRSISRGLKPPKTVAKGTLIAYAAGAGQTADDGAGQNGIFTQHFLQAIKTPNVNVRDAMDWVASSVSSETNGEQVPAVYAEFVGEFYFSVK